MGMTRREALTALAVGAFAFSAEPARAARVDGPHSLPPLPYPASALEPHIDAQTMTIHHGKHHQAYVDKLNEALKKASGSTRII